MKHIKKFENLESTYKIKEFYFKSKYGENNFMALYINGEYYIHGYFNEDQNIREYIDGFYSCLDFLKVKYDNEEFEIDSNNYDYFYDLFYNGEPTLDEIESIINAKEMGLM